VYTVVFDLRVVANFLGCQCAENAKSDKLGAWDSGVYHCQWGEQPLPNWGFKLLPAQHHSICLILYNHEYDTHNIDLNGFRDGCVTVT